MCGRVICNEEDFLRECSNQLDDRKQQINKNKYILPHIIKEKKERKKSTRSYFVYIHINYPQLGKF